MRLSHFALSSAQDFPRGTDRAVSCPGEAYRRSGSTLHIGIGSPDLRTGRLRQLFLETACAILGVLQVADLIGGIGVSDVSLPSPELDISPSSS